MQHGNETCVIDDDLIKQSYNDEENLNGPNRAEPLTMSEISVEARTLRLSFKNIWRIDNLAGLERLTKLCLDNNIIETVVNLGHLVNLRWLDLSFNNIKEISGMENLVNLEDLTLYNNEISTLQGLDNCVKLDCISIGNNNIKVLDSLMYLRRFKNLRLVHAEGNPVCTDPEYKFYLLSHLRHLKYLDYSLVSASDVMMAREQYQDELLELEEEESIRDASDERDEQRAAVVAELRKANLDIPDALYENMMKDDTEMVKFASFPGLSGLLEQFQASFEMTCEPFKQAALERAAHRNKEYGAFVKVMSTMQTNSEDQARRVVDTFIKKKKRVFAELRARDTVDPQDFDELRQATALLGETLMELETQQVEKFEDLINEIDNAFTEMKKLCLDANNDFFRGVEEMEEACFEALQALTLDLLEKSANDLLGDDVPDAVKTQLLDRDTCLNAIAGSHDQHMDTLLHREDDVRNREIALFNGMLDQHTDGEYTRSRTRGMEINQLLEKQYDDMDALLTEAADVDYDED